MAQDCIPAHKERPIVDARGLNCPLPVLKLRKRLGTLPAGSEVELLATDRAALKDVPAFCEAAGHLIVNTTRDGSGVRFVVRKSAA